MDSNKYCVPFNLKLYPNNNSSFFIFLVIFEISFVFSSSFINIILSFIILRSVLSPII